MLEPSGFREIARSATVTYPIPFTFALCLALTVATLGGAIVAQDLLRWVLVGFGAVSMSFAFGLLTLTVLRRPELLRSERQEIRHRIMDFIEDSDISPASVEATLIQLDGPKSTKHKKQDRNGGEE